MRIGWYNSGDGLDTIPREAGCCRAVHVRPRGVAGRMRRIVPRSPSTWSTSAGSSDPLPGIEGMLAEKVMGDPAATISMIEYSSLTCTYCAEFHADTLPLIQEHYIDTGKVKLIYRDFPLDNGSALSASIVARCSGDRFFTVLDASVPDPGDVGGQLERDKRAHRGGRPARHDRGGSSRLPGQHRTAKRASRPCGRAARPSTASGRCRRSSSTARRSRARYPTAASPWSSTAFLSDAVVGRGLSPVSAGSPRPELAEGRRAAGAEALGERRPEGPPYAPNASVARYRPSAATSAGGSMIGPNGISSLPRTSTTVRPVLSAMLQKRSGVRTGLTWAASA